MTAAIRLFTVIPLLLIACNNESNLRVPRSQSQPGSINVLNPRVDTLLGIRLGMFEPEVRGAWRRVGRPLECPGGVEAKTCFNGFRTSPVGQILVAFRDGQVQNIMYMLGEDWKNVPVSAFIARQLSFGAPGRRVDAEGFFAIWAADSAYRKVACPRSQPNCRAV